MAGRRCSASGCPKILTDGSRTCPAHLRAREQARGSRRDRGYDAAHDRLRAAWQARLDAGEVIYCADGCGTRVDPASWDLGHDHVNGGYLGPMTAEHNRADGGRRAHL